MENLSANSSVSYMELGDNNTLREVTTPNTEATNNTDEIAPRERDAGSVTSANFDPENLRQLSSTRLEPDVSPTEVPPRTPSPTTVNPTTQLTQNELSPQTSRLLATLLLKLSSDIKDSYEKLGNRLVSQMEKMDSRMEKWDKELKEDMKQMNNQIEKTDGGLREETRDVKGEMKEKRKQLDDTIVCPNQGVDDMQMNLRKEPENLEKQTKTDIQQAVEKPKTECVTTYKDLEKQIRDSTQPQEKSVQEINTQLSLTNTSLNTTQIQVESLVTDIQQAIEKQKTECVITYQNLEKQIRDSTQPLEKSVQEVNTQLSLTDTSPNTASNTDKDNNPPPSTNIPSKTNGKSDNPSGKNSSGDHHARLGGEKTYKTLTVQIPAAQSKAKRQSSKINRRVYHNSGFHRKHARYKKPTAFENYACFHPRHIRFKPAIKSGDCKIWTPKPNLS